MSEYRLDRTAGRWVIIAPERGGRPHAIRARTAEQFLRALPQYDPNCPFCPGNDAQLPGIIAAIPSTTDPRWTVRVVPNKFAAVDANGDARNVGAPFRPAYGFHEVIIESPRHDADLSTMTDGEIAAVVSAYRQRCAALMQREGIEAVVLFRNHGPAGGASLAHPHAQIMAIALVPPLAASFADWGARYHREHGSCPTCELIAGEREAAVRVVEETSDFLVLVPPAAAHPCEMWILPKHHQASFIDLEEHREEGFARLLRRSLVRLRRARGNPPYNFAIDTATRTHLGAPYVHWRLRIAPDLATSGGFELGSAIPINPSSPELDAAALREAAPS